MIPCLPEQFPQQDVTASSNSAGKTSRLSEVTKGGNTILADDNVLEHRHVSAGNQESSLVKSIRLLTYPWHIRDKKVVHGFLVHLSKKN